MLRSFWFWLISIIALFVIWMARDQITSFVENLPVEQPARTTNTQELAKTLTPGEALGLSSRAVSASASPVATTTASSTSGKSSAVKSLTTIYTIQSGDTLYSIARKYDTDVETLIKLNKIWDPTSLQVGEKLMVPKKTTPTKTAASPTPAIEKRKDVYIVQPGDTMTSIAQKHGVSVTELVKLNNINNPNNLRVGSLIIVPTPQPTPKPTVGAPSAEKVTALSMAAPTLQPTPTPTPRFTPTPTPPPNPSACATGTRVALVWGASFCAPEGWRWVEQAPPDRGIFLILEEEKGDASIIAVLRPQGMPYAPLGWSLRTTKAAMPSQIALFVPGGMDKIAWGEAGNTTIAGELGLVTEATATYARSGRQARLRLFVFNHEGQRWTVFLLAPQDKWGRYRETIFPVVLNSLRVF